MSVDTTARAVAGLVARTVALDDLPDLGAEAAVEGAHVWLAGADGLVGHGEAVRLHLPGGLADAEGVRAVSTALSALVAEDEVSLPGTGPVALGALAFDPSAPSTLVVPRRLVARRGDRAWVTTVGPPGAALDDAVEPPPAVAPLAPDSFELTSAMPHDRWRAVVADAVAHIRATGMDKVVLARAVDVTANRPFPLGEIMARLRALYPACFVFSLDGFIGATPELLLRRTGDEVASHPLAGTVARSGDDASDRALVAGLLASAKERWEHQLVLDTLARTLGAHCTDLTVPSVPDIVALRNVSHLATRVHGTLRTDSDGARPTALDLVAAIHPTPAVGGTPTADALGWQCRVEGFDRGRYGGPVGWVDARGDGCFAVGIRSADIDGHRARMYAGVGVVADSDPVAELAETQLKLQALLAALVRP